VYDIDGEREGSLPRDAVLFIAGIVVRLGILLAPLFNLSEVLLENIGVYVLTRVLNFRNEDFVNVYRVIAPELIRWTGLRRPRGVCRSALRLPLLSEL